MAKERLKLRKTHATKDELDEIDEHLTILSRRFSKLKFKRNPNMYKPSTHFRKEGQQNKSFVDKSKFKYYNCGMVVKFLK